jgi:hypothetical protein
LINNFVFLSQFLPDCKRRLQKPDRGSFHQVKIPPSIPSGSAHDISSQFAWVIRIRFHPERTNLGGE